MRTALRSYRAALDESLRGVREANAALRVSLRTFSEGGNFCSEEVEEFGAVLHALGARIDTAEGAVVADLDGVEGRYVGLSDALLSGVHSTHAHAARDAAFVADGERRLRTAALQLQSEVSLDDARAAAIDSDIAAAAGAANGPDLLATLRRMAASIGSRMVFLECAASVEAVEPGSPTLGRRTISDDPQRRLAERRPPARARTQLSLPHGMRVLVDGYGPPDGTTLLGLANDIRTRCRQDLLEAAATFYHDLQRGVPRALTRPGMRDSIHTYADWAQEAVGELYRCALAHRAAAIGVFEGQLSHLAEVVQPAAARVFQQLVADVVAAIKQVCSSRAHLPQDVDDAQATLDAATSEHAGERVALVAQLRPALGHPHRLVERKTLCAAVDDVAAKVQRAWQAHTDACDGLERKHARRFLTASTGLCADVLAALGGCLKDASSVTTGSVAPRPLLELLDSTQAALAGPAPLVEEKLLGVLASLPGLDAGSVAVRFPDLPALREVVCCHRHATTHLDGMVASTRAARQQRHAQAAATAADRAAEWERDVAAVVQLYD